MAEPSVQKATPGPWELVAEGHRLSVWAEGHGFVHTHKAPEVNPEATSVANANSRLIATAPELLVMLKEVFGGMMCICKLSPLAGMPVPCQTCRIKSVIAKAEGR